MAKTAKVSSKKTELCFEVALVKQLSTDLLALINCTPQVTKGHSAIISVVTEYLDNKGRFTVVSNIIHHKKSKNPFPWLNCYDFLLVLQGGKKRAVAVDQCNFQALTELSVSL